MLHPVSHTEAENFHVYNFIGEVPSDVRRATSGEINFTYPPRLFILLQEKLFTNNSTSIQSNRVPYACDGHVLNAPVHNPFYV